MLIYVTTQPQLRSTLVGPRRLSSRSCLVGVRQATHAAHDTQNVVVRGIHIHVGRGLLVAGGGGIVAGGRSRIGAEGSNVRLERGGGQRQVEHSVINTGEVARAAGLQVLRLEGEGIHVDTRRRGRGVVLVGLHEVEVAALTLRETILAVELDLGDRRGVAKSGIRVAPRSVGLGGAVIVAGVLDNPDELLARVVEGELDLVGRGSHRLRARELQLLNEVLVGDLGEAATLLSVEVDVIHIERAGDQAGAADGAQHGRDRGLKLTSASRNVNQVLKVLELDVDLHLVVLQRNQRQRQASVAIEPELQRNVESLLRDAARHQGLARTTRARLLETMHNRIRRKRAIIAEVGQHGVQAGQGGGILRVELRHAGIAVGSRRQCSTTVAVHHVEVGQRLARGERQLIPHVQPLTVVLVDLLTTNLNIHVVDHVLAQVGHPREGGITNQALVDGRKSHLHIHAGDQIAVTGDGALHTLAEVAHTVEGLLDGLHGEVRVATVELLKKSNLRVCRQIHVLGAIGDELH